MKKIMNYNRYRWCVMSSCKNNSVKTPKKLFIQVPDNIERRNVWLELAKRDPKSLSTKSRLYLCEDHFNLEQDMENYMEYKIMGSVKHVKMKLNATPFIQMTVEIHKENADIVMNKSQNIKLEPQLNAFIIENTLIDENVTEDTIQMEQVVIKKENLTTEYESVKMEKTEEFIMDNKYENIKIEQQLNTEVIIKNEKFSENAVEYEMEHVVIKEENLTTEYEEKVKMENREESEHENIYENQETYNQSIFMEPKRGENSLTCNICYKIFTYKSSLIRHQLHMHTEKTIPCDFCEKKFHHQSGLVKHQEMHTADKPFSCDVCNKTFNYRNYLKHQKQLHSGTGCDKKTFFENRIHSGENAFKCEVCNKTFASKSTLTRHKLRIHATERFSCEK